MLSNQIISLKQEDRQAESRSLEALTNTCEIWNSFSIMTASSHPNHFDISELGTFNLYCLWHPVTIHTPWKRQLLLGMTHSFPILIHLPSLFQAPSSMSSAMPKCLGNAEAALCGGLTENPPQGSGVIRRSGFAGIGWPCWRKCVTVGVGFKVPMLKLYPERQTTSCCLWEI